MKFHKIKGRVLSAAFAALISSTLLMAGCAAPDKSEAQR